MSARKVLNIGGGDKNIPVPAYFGGWTHHLLDIDPAGKPDIVCDARKLQSLEPGSYDAIYCSHNIEHYYPHDVPKVLAGFTHVLKTDGFAEIRCPDLEAVMRAMIERGLDIDSVLYQSALGPILVRDAIYGYGRQIAESGNDYYAHKTGFTRNSLQKALAAAGFQGGWMLTGPFELIAYAFKTTPTAEQKELLQFR